MEAAAEKSRSATVLDLQAWTYYNLYWTTSWGSLLSDLHVPHEQWVLDRHFWSIFCLLFMGIRHLSHMLTVPPTKACLLCAIYTGPCPKALTECSLLDFWRSSIVQGHFRVIKLCHKQMHISKLFSYSNPFSGQISKINPYQKNNHCSTFSPLAILFFSFIPVTLAPSQNQNKTK